MLFKPTLNEVKKLSKKGNVIPVYKEILADMETPVSAYKKISKQQKYSFLLESVEGGEHVARFSFLGVDPFLVFRSRGKKIRLEGEINKQMESDPIIKMRELINQYKPVSLPGLPSLSGGAVGYFAYDTVRLVEVIPNNTLNDLDMDEIIFGFYDTILIFDNRRHKIIIVSNVMTQRGKLEGEYKKACQKISQLENLLKSPVENEIVHKGKSVKMESNFKIEEFKKSVEKCKEYIKAGDVFQVVLSQRFSSKITADPFDIYRMLRIVNPSPYNFYLKYDDLDIAGSSPELLVRVENGEVETRPLAGTRKRGKTPEEDRALEKELLADEKERAEHIMLVDLGRNDLGRVCEYSTVRVHELMGIERYSHVMHIVSSVKGSLQKGKDQFDALFSCFPAGTLSGAPKIRAMEIIDELEPTTRSIYGGAVGYLDFSGNLDSCIVIRTILIKDGKAYVQAGAGIVADSIPELEYKETINKAKALFKAIEIAELGPS